MTWI